MTLIESSLLGVIQGLTEFLPVSSSGHIEIGQAILGTESLKDQEELLSVVLHAATALATIFVFAIVFLLNNYVFVKTFSLS